MDNAAEVVGKITFYMQSIANIGITDDVRIGIMFDKVSVGGRAANPEGVANGHIAALLDAHAVYHLESALYEADKRVRSEDATDEEINLLRTVKEEVDPIIAAIKERGAA